MRKIWNSGKAVLACVAAVWMLVAPASEAQADYSQSKLWFESQIPANRIALQDALFWSGEYLGPLDAKFGSQTYASLTSFQMRRGAAPTGVLSASQRAALQKEAQRIRQLVFNHSQRSASAPNRMHRSTGYALASPILILP
jgi:peptidoglycan hydrolase-like protein with peptidoglycan-binding domain